MKNFTPRADTLEFMSELDTEILVPICFVRALAESKPRANG